tara:strand:- start:1648 stop:2070 length:423 start_codon:yes stop_codon:yes gene_type:complete
MNWIKEILRKLLLSVGLKPVLLMCIEFLEDKATETSNPYDNDGVAVLKSIIEKDDYRIEVLLEEVVIKFREITKRTENEYDDLLGDILYDIVTTKSFKREEAYNIIKKRCESYAATTQTPVDDLAVDVLDILIKQLGFIK